MVMAIGACLSAILGFSPPGAGADVDLGAENGISYVADQTPAVGSPGESPTVFARCQADRDLVGGGVAMNIGDTTSHLHWIYPTTTEGPEGSYALRFWNNSGSPLVGTATAACARDATTAYRAMFGTLGSAPDALSLTATCRPSEQVGGGGAFMSLEGATEGVISSSYPVDGGDGDAAPDDAWRIKVRSRAGIGGSTTAYAICTDRPRLVYRSKRVELPVSATNQPSVACGSGRAAVSAGIKVGGTASEAILNRLETYDGGDSDLAPDDGGWAHLANLQAARRATVFVVCRA